MIPQQIVERSKALLRVQWAIQNTETYDRTLLVRPRFGLGNRQLTEAAGLLIAIATRRKLIIDHEEKYYMIRWTSGIYSHTNVTEILAKNEITMLNELACMDFDSIESSTLKIDGLMAIPMLHTNPSLAEMIDSNFGRYAFYIAHNFLHQPSPPMIRAIDEYRKKEFSGAEYVLGIQARFSVC